MLELLEKICTTSMVFFLIAIMVAVVSEKGLKNNIDSRLLVSWGILLFGSFGIALTTFLAIVWMK